jgi:hypothetical protein
MYIYIIVYICISAYIYMHIYTFIYIHIHLCTNIHVGDEVEFIGIRGLGVAVGVVVLPKRLKESGI